MAFNEKSWGKLQAPGEPPHLPPQEADEFLCGHSGQTGRRVPNFMACSDKLRFIYHLLQLLGTSLKCLSAHMISDVAEDMKGGRLRSMNN